MSTCIVQGSVVETGDCLGDELILPAFTLGEEEEECDHRPTENVSTAELPVDLDAIARALQGAARQIIEAAEGSGCTLPIEAKLKLYGMRDEEF